MRGDQRAKRRAGAAGEIGDRDRRLAGERRRHRIEHRRVARAPVVGLAQRQPGGAENAHASASIAPANSLAESCQVGSAVAGGARARREPLRARPDSSISIAQRARQRRRHRRAATSTPALGRHRFGNGAAGRADHRQAVRQRLGDRPCRSPRSARPARTGRRRHKARRCVRRTARRAPRSGRRACAARYRRRAARPSPRSRVRSPAMVSRHGRSASVASAAISTSKPLRGTTEPTESSRTMPSLAAVARRRRDRCRARATVMRSGGTP